jgi:WD40 repeat protein
VLSGYEDGTVALWDIRRTDKYVSADKMHSESVMSLAVAPGNCSLGFSGAADDTLTAFDICIPKGSIALARKLSLPKPGVADVAIRPDNRIAASAGWDGKIRIWHAVKCQPLAILKWHSQQVAAVTFSSNSQLLAAAGRDNQISIWSLYQPA